MTLYAVDKRGHAIQPTDDLTQLFAAHLALSPVMEEIGALAGEPKVPCCPSSCSMASTPW